MASEPLAPIPTQASGKGGIYAAVAAIAAVVIAAFLFLGGDKTGGLVISVAGPGGTAIQGVSVLVDGKEVCQDSVCKVEDLEPGSYVVKAKADGYAEMAGKAYEVVAGEQKPINLELVQDGGGTGLKVSSKASGLTLSVDGKKIGALPQEVTDIEPGEHVIELSGSPFIKEFKETVTVKDGEMLEVEPDLELVKGQVNIKLDSSADGAKVVLIDNGKRRSLASTIKKAKSDTVKIDLPVKGKTYSITATRKGYEDFEEQLEFSVEEPIYTVDLTLSEEGDDDEASRPSPSPSPQPSPGIRPSPAPAPSPQPTAGGQGKLNINSIPVSTVILDGRPLGTTPKVGVSVSAGSHTVVFIHPEHGRKVRQVNVTAGGVATAAVRFP